MEFANETPAVDLSFLQNDEAAKLFAESEEIQPGDVPEGTYNAEIVEASVQISQNSGNPMIVWSLRCTEGPYQGRYLPAHRNMLPVIAKKKDGSTDWDLSDDVATQKQKWGRIKGELALCQIPLASLSELPNALSQLAETVIEVKVKKQKDSDFYNVHIQKYVGKGSQIDGPPTTNSEATSF